MLYIFTLSNGVNVGDSLKNIRSSSYYDSSKKELVITSLSEKCRFKVDFTNDSVELIAKDVETDNIHDLTNEQNILMRALLFSRRGTDIIVKTYHELQVDNDENSVVTIEPSIISGINNKCFLLCDIQVVLKSNHKNITAEYDDYSYFINEKKFLTSNVKVAYFTDMYKKIIDKEAKDIEAKLSNYRTLIHCYILHKLGFDLNKKIKEKYDKRFAAIEKEFKIEKKIDFKVDECSLEDIISSYTNVSIKSFGKICIEQTIPTKLKAFIKSNKERIVKYKSKYDKCKRILFDNMYCVDSSMQDHILEEALYYFEYLDLLTTLSHEEEEDINTFMIKKSLLTNNVESLPNAFCYDLLEHMNDLQVVNRSRKIIAQKEIYYKHSTQLKLLKEQSNTNCLLIIISILSLGTTIISLLVTYYNK